jgi:hypothetical protein
MATEEPNYTKGFNQGYKLARYSPEIFEKLKESLHQENEFDKGILEGAEQWNKEKEQNRLAELNQLSQEPDRQKDLER